MTTAEKQTITAADVSVASAVPPNPLALADMKVGMVVMFVDQRLNTHPSCWVDAMHESNVENVVGREAMVIAIEPSKPGKVVALAFREPIRGGHSCDERVKAGHGAYALPGQLYTPKALEQHKALTKVAADEQTRVDALLKDFYK